MLEELLAGYATADDRYDELLAAPGEPRAHWQLLAERLAERGSKDVQETLALTERQVREHGVTYNVYADAAGVHRPWQVDPLPLMLPADEWRAIEAGIAQRADLLNRVLGDLYGAQTLLRSGAIPPPVVFGHRNFIGPAIGLAPAGGRHLLQYAADLARSPDGRWWVVSDRTQAPSGSGYALENRLVVSRVFPQMFRELPVQHLASFFDALRQALAHWAPRSPGEPGPPRIALLTPGPYNETYFEHALLARYLGFTLVEGSDLTVRDDRVWLKTIRGLERVHAIVRRQDDDYCDPLELRSDSALGVPGLTQAARRGHVLMANAIGSGILESGALLGYLPKLARRMLGEELALPSVATWWLGEPAALADAWRRPERLIVKPLERNASERPVVVEDLDAAGRAALRARIDQRPQHFVAQEWVHVSQAPVLEKAPAGLVSRHVGLRVFAVATPSGWRVMPGGLARVAGDDPRVIAMQRGGRSKDTWVLSDEPVNASFSLLAETVGPGQLVGPEAAVPSRAAENLFWFGRYGERCEASVRLLRVALGEILEEGTTKTAGVRPAWTLAQRLGLLESTRDAPRSLRRAATRPDGALGQRLGQLSRVAFSLRDRMSADHWRTLNRLTADAVFNREPTLPATLVWLDRALTAMVTLSGFVLDGMTRGVAWRFLSMGRHIERLSTMSAAVQVAIGEGRSHDLDWLLAFADSGVTYRSRYLAAPEWLPVLDMVVRDTSNPRSLACQAAQLAEDVAWLEAGHGRFLGQALPEARRALASLAPADLRPESDALADAVGAVNRAVHAASDELSIKFFSHAVPRSMLSLVA